MVYNILARFPWSGAGKQGLPSASSLSLSSQNRHITCKTDRHAQQDQRIATAVQSVKGVAVDLPHILRSTNIFSTIQADASETHISTSLTICPVFGE